jgi:hypothetical protein
MSVYLANPRHEVLYQELLALSARYVKDVPQIEMLAVAANMVGKLIAMQDQKTCTPNMSMEIVARNIEYGNQQVLDQLKNTRGSS